MNGLDVLIALTAALFAFLLGVYAYRVKYRSMPLTVGFAVLVLASSVAVYAGFGRYADWQNEQTGVETNYMLAAKIAEARRMVKNMPNNARAQSELAEALYEAGQYGEAVEVFNEFIRVGGESAEALGRLARAMYYRDARVITAETHRVIERALSINALDVQTRMLLGEDAFMHQRYDEAVSHWQCRVQGSVARLIGGTLCLSNKKFGSVCGEYCERKD